MQYFPEVSPVKKLQYLNHTWAVSFVVFCA